MTSLNQSLRLMPHPESTGHKSNGIKGGNGMGRVDGLTVAITVAAAGFDRATVEMMGPQHPIGRAKTAPEMTDFAIECPRSPRASLITCSTDPANDGSAAR